MKDTIIITSLVLVIVILILIIGWLFLSKSRKVKISLIQKEAKQTKKAIIASGYREIGDLKNEFQREKEKYLHDFELQNLRLNEELSLLNKKQELVELKQSRLDSYEISLEKRNKEYDKKISETIDNLEELSGYSKTEAKELLLKQMKQRTQKEINSYIKNAELEAYKRAKTTATNIIINSMEKYATDIVNEKTTNIIKLTNDDLKGRIIGKEGRNIKAFEQYGGVDIIIDETPETITVSSFNPIRRTIATKALEKLLQDGRIQPAKIESELKKQEKELDNLILEEGQKVVYELGILDMDIELVKLIGKLKYRTSYGQSVLLHSVEVAKISGAIAAELGLNVKEATRAGLLHDIGKAVDFEQDGSHVILGIQAAKNYGESDIVINAIAAHHEDFPKESTIASIVAIADSISASRPGARNNNMTEFFQRMNDIEKICNEIPGVDKTYALQSGRQIRIIVDPIAINDSDLIDIIEKVKAEIRKNIIVPGEITITVIREKREIQIIK